MSSDTCTFHAINVSECCYKGVCELAAVMAEMGHQSLVVVCLYRPPGGDSMFLDSMQDCLDSIIVGNFTIVPGNFNVDFDSDGNE